MEEINIGDVHLVYDGNTLILSRRDQGDWTLSLDAAGVAELIHFVTSLSGTGFNRRQNFRVPVDDSSGLSVQIRSNEKMFSVIPKNISATGIFVELRPEEWLDLSQNDDLAVILAFEGKTQTYRGVVRRRQDEGYGLFFPESIKAEHVDPPPELTRVLMALQRRWMARRE